VCNKNSHCSIPILVWLYIMIYCASAYLGSGGGDGHVKFGISYVLLCS
jgi:hypothetical protein